MGNWKICLWRLCLEFAQIWNTKTQRGLHIDLHHTYIIQSQSRLLYFFKWKSICSVRCKRTSLDFFLVTGMSQHVHLYAKIMARLSWNLQSTFKVLRRVTISTLDTWWAFLTSGHTPCSQDIKEDNKNKSYCMNLMKNLTKNKQAIRTLRALCSICLTSPPPVSLLRICSSAV